jgi:hypothetical protein
VGSSEKLKQYIRSRFGFIDSAPHSTFAFVAPPFAHTWRTLQPGAARRLVLPNRGVGATGAPILARSILRSTGGILGGLGKIRMGKFG